MDNLPQQLLAFAQKYDMLPSAGLVLCAVSGGADSMCLLWVLQSLSSSFGFSVGAMHYNHRLRGASSDSDEEFVRSFCVQNSIPAWFDSCDIAAESRRRRRGIEETARIMRYEFFERTAKELGAVRIATAHNANDNAETTLMNLIRGTALSGLGGIPPVRGKIIRPLLQTTRASILNYLHGEGIDHVEDESNSETLYTRNKLRHELIPLLRDWNPRIIETIGKTASFARADDDYLYSLAEQALTQVRPVDGGYAVKTETLNSLPPVLASRVILLLIDKIGCGRGNVSSVHIEGALALAKSSDPSASLSLPRGILLQKVYSELYMQLGSKLKETFLPTALSSNGTAILLGNKWEITCAPANSSSKNSNLPNTFFIKRDMIMESLLVRPRQPGDRISLPGRGGSKSVKKLFIDEKVPLSLREMIPVISDGKKLVAVAGFGIDQSYCALPGEEALVIKIKGEVQYGQHFNRHRTRSSF